MSLLDLFRTNLSGDMLSKMLADLPNGPRHVARVTKRYADRKDRAVQRAQHRKNARENAKSRARAREFTQFIYSYQLYDALVRKHGAREARQLDRLIKSNKISFKEALGK